MDYELTTPLDRERVKALRAGDTVRLSGVIYTARDAAHRRMAEALAAGQALPIPLEGAVIYYAGPTPAPPGRVVGSIGPTTAGRMDSYAPALLRLGLAGMIGKGARREAVLEAIREHGAVYFGFLGGAGALASACVTECETVAYEDLGSEAIRRLRVREFPLTVLADCAGGNLYESGPAAYLAHLAAEAGT